MFSLFSLSCTYVHAVRKLANLFFKRFVTMWQYVDFLYYKSPDGKNFRKFLKVALDFSRQVIVKRQAKRGQERVFRDLLDILIDARVRRLFFFYIEFLIIT